MHRCAIDWRKPGLFGTTEILAIALGMIFSDQLFLHQGALSTRRAGHRMDKNIQLMYVVTAVNPSIQHASIQVA